MNATSDITRRLHHGVIAALVHVASVRPPGTPALAIEFDAAERTIMERVRSPSVPQVLKTAFSTGLSLPTFKAMMKDNFVGDRRLLGLRRGELIEVMDAQLRADYRDLVLAAARAALLADIEDSCFCRRRLKRWERRVLQDIESMLETKPDNPPRADGARAKPDPEFLMEGYGRQATGYGQRKALSALAVASRP